MKQENIDEINELNTVSYAMKWYGWGSPIGVSVFLLTLVIIAAILKIVFFA